MKLLLFLCKFIFKKYSSFLIMPPPKGRCFDFYPRIPRRRKLHEKNWQRFLTRTRSLGRVETDGNHVFRGCFLKGKKTGFLSVGRWRICRERTVRNAFLKRKIGSFLGQTRNDGRIGIHGSNVFRNSFLKGEKRDLGTIPNGGACEGRAAPRGFGLFDFRTDFRKNNAMIFLQNKVRFKRKQQRHSQHFAVLAAPLFATPPQALPHAAEPRRP